MRGQRGLKIQSAKGGQSNVGTRHPNAIEEKKRSISGGKYLIPRKRFENKNEGKDLN